MTRYPAVRFGCGEESAVDFRLLCEEPCERHAARDEYCRRCVEACRRCRIVCERLAAMIG